MEAVHAGDIFWHAMPFNTQVELFDAPLLQYAVEMTHELDARFGQPPKKTMSQVLLALAAIPAVSINILIFQHLSASLEKGAGASLITSAGTPRCPAIAT